MGRGGVGGKVNFVIGSSLVNEQPFETSFEQADWPLFSSSYDNLHQGTRSRTVRDVTPPIAYVGRLRLRMRRVRIKLDCLSPLWSELNRWKRWVVGEDTSRLQHRFVTVDNRAICVLDSYFIVVAYRQNSRHELGKCDLESPWSVSLFLKKIKIKC